MDDIAQDAQQADSKPKKGRQKKERPQDFEPVNCLRDEKVIVRFINKPHPLVQGPNHIASGGLVRDGKRTFSLPRLTSGSFKNCLTNNEKDFLEMALGLQYNALSVYNNENNFWESGNGGAEITLSKEDRVLDLSKPNEYILYKMLLANTNTICPSLKELQNRPKASYQYVIVNQNDEARLADDEMTTTQKCYIRFGKYSDDTDTLRTVLEMIQNRQIDEHTKIEFLRKQIKKEIDMNPKLFLSIMDDDLLDAKVIVRRAAKNGIISKRGDFYYLTEDNQALCEPSQDPTLENAARYISSPKRNDLYIKIQAKLNPR